MNVSNLFSRFTEDHNVKEVLSGSIWVLIGRSFATVFGILVTVVVARKYGADILGTFALINSVFMVATIFTLFGTNTSIMRLIPEYIAKYSVASAYQIYRKIQVLVIGVSVLVGILLVFGAFDIASIIFTDPNFYGYISLIGFLLVFKSLLIFNTQAMRGLKLVRVFSFFQALPQFLNLVIIFVLGVFMVSDQIPLYSLFASVIVSGIIGLVIVNQEFKKKITRTQKLNYTRMREIFLISAPMFMTGVINIISAEFGVLMIGAFGDEAQVGFFVVAVKVATLIGFMLKAINSIIAPKISELYYSNKKSELEYLLKSIAKFVFWLSFPCLVVLIIWGEVILVFLFGEEFSSSYKVLVCLVFAQFVNSVSGCTGILMNMTGCEKQYRNIVLVGAVVMMCFGAIIIPKYGIIGAAVAVLIGECIWNLSALFYIKKYFGFNAGYIPVIWRFRRAVVRPGQTYENLYK